METMQTKDISASDILYDPLPDVLEISNSTDLDKISRLPTGVRQISLRISIPAVDDERRRELENRVKKHLSACGCNEGSVTGILYLIVLAVIFFSGEPWPSTFIGWLGLFGGLIGALFFGKIFGLAKARFKLARTLAEIKKLFASQKQNSIHA